MTKDNPDRTSRTDRRAARVGVARTAGWLLRISLAGTVAAASSIVFLLLYLRTQALPAAAIPETTQIYDIGGKVIDTVYKGQNRDAVDLSQVSPYLVKATLAVEDHRYYEHHAFDLAGLARAAFVDVTHLSKVQGGSTITQQLAWNLYLTHEKTWQRKVKEAFYAIELEMRYSKDEILEKYLNQIYYGHSLYGIESASQAYFGIPAAKLDLAQSALLAGVPKGPALYSPYLNPKRAKSRQRTVLNAMVRYGYANRAEADAAYNEPLKFLPLKGDAPAKAPYFRDYVRSQAKRILGVTDTQFDQGGYKIYTTLDLHAQQLAEAEVRKYTGNRPGLQAALISIDPRTGYIRAMVGGKDYTRNQFNRVFADSRQPGSSFKGILYLAALREPGFTASTQFASEPTLFTYDNGRKTYAPSNFADDYTHQAMGLREAIARSDNIYAVNTIMQIGPERVIDMARRLGIEAPMQPVPSLALGTFPVSPFEMASAYAAIANQGLRVRPVAILQIRDASGEVVYQARPQAEQVVDRAVAYVLTNLLESVFDPGGTGYRVAGHLKRPVAGKSGTTDTDAWMVGYTPDLATAVWVGYDRGRKINAVESHLAAPIFAEYTEQTLAGTPPLMFPIPPGVTSVYIDPRTGLLAAADCPNPQLDPYVRGTEPTAYSPLYGGGDPLTPTDAGQAHRQAPRPRRDNAWWRDLKRWWRS